MTELTLEQRRERELALARARARPKTKSRSDTLLDTVGQGFRYVDDFVRGAADTLTFGFADEIAAGANSLFAGDDYETALKRERQRDAEGGKARLAGQIVGGLTGGAGLAKSGLSPAYNVARNSGGFVKSVPVSAIEGGAHAAAYGYGSGEGGVKNRMDVAQPAGLFGAAVGGGFPIALRTGQAAWNKWAPQRKIAPELTRQVSILDDEGIPLTAGQRRGSERLRRMESNLGGSKAERITDNQAEEFTRAALRRIGVDAPRATPEVLDSAYDRIGLEIGNLAQRNQLVVDKPFVEELARAVVGYQGAVPPGSAIPQVQNLAREVFQAARVGMTGEAYRSLHSRISEAARAAAKDSNLSGAYNALTNAMDDAMERSILARNPGDLSAWKNARNSYRNLSVIKGAATADGSDAALGIIAPSELRAATIAQHGPENYARGKGDFAQLARAGEGVMRPLPNRGIADNLKANIPFLRTGSSAAIGGTVGTTLGGQLGGAVGTAIGAASPIATGQALMSRPVQKALSGQRVISNEMIEAMVRHGIQPKAEEGGRQLREWF